MGFELTQDFKDRFENLIATVMTQARIPGLSVAMVKDNQVIYLRGFGARRLRDNLPATPHTLYGIGSCTKSFTALAIMQLAEQGKLSLQTPVNKYVPIKIGSKENPITIHHLLTHSSGMPNLGSAEIAISRMYEIDEKWIPLSSFEDIIQYVNGASEEIVAKPGEKFFYFNLGYTILGEIIERVSGLKYEYYIKDKILRPLKMNRSTFLKDEFEKDSDTMTSYLVQSETDRPTAPPIVHPFHKFVYAAGGLLSPVSELANYLVANMNDGVFGDTRILGATSLQEMQKLHVETQMKTKAHAFGSHGKEGYGYGWSVWTDFLGHKLVRHGGSTAVSGALLAFVPDLKIGIAGAVNVGMPPQLVFLSGLAFLAGKDPEKEFPFFRREKNLGMLAGLYQTYKGITKVSVVKREGLLYIEAKEKLMEMTAPLIPETEQIENLKFHIISATGDKTPVEFVIDPSGRIDMYLEDNRFHKVTT